MVTKPRATDHLFAFLSLPPASPLQTGLGQTAGGAEEKPRTWDLQISGSQTYAPDKHGGATNPTFQKVSAALFDILCLWNRALWVLCQFKILKTRTVCSQIIGDALTILYIFVLLECIDGAIHHVLGIQLHNKLYIMSSTGSSSCSVTRLE